MKQVKIKFAMHVMHWREKADVFCGFTLLPSGSLINAVTRAMQSVLTIVWYLTQYSWHFLFHGFRVSCHKLPVVLDNGCTDSDIKNVRIGIVTDIGCPWVNVYKQFFSRAGWSFTREKRHKYAVEAAGAKLDYTCYHSPAHISDIRMLYCHPTFHAADLKLDALFWTCELNEQLCWKINMWYTLLPPIHYVHPVSSQLYPHQPDAWMSGTSQKCVSTHC